MYYCHVIPNSHSCDSYWIVTMFDIEIERNIKCRHWISLISKIFVTVGAMAVEPFFLHSQDSPWLKLVLGNAVPTRHRDRVIPEERTDLRLKLTRDHALTEAHPFHKLCRQSIQRLILLLLFMKFLIIVIDVMFGIENRRKEYVAHVYNLGIW